MAGGTLFRYSYVYVSVRDETVALFICEYLVRGWQVKGFEQVEHESCGLLGSVVMQ